MHEALIVQNVVTEDWGLPYSPNQCLLSLTYHPFNVRTKVSRSMQFDIFFDTAYLITQFQNLRRRVQVRVGVTVDDRCLLTWFWCRRTIVAY